MRDFHRARYGNPLFGRRASTQRTRPRFQMSPWMLAGTAGLLLLGAAWYALWGPAFRITAVEITGLTGPSADAIRTGLDHHMQGAAFMVFPRSNILIFDKTKALDDIAGKVYLDTISIRKKLPGTLEVEAKEKITRVALDWDDRLFALDEAGYVLRELTDAEIALLGDLPPGLAAVQVQGLGAETMDLAKDAGAAAGQEQETDAKKTAPGREEDETESAEPTKTRLFPLIVGGGEGEQGKDGAEAAPGQAMFGAATMRTILQANSRLPDVAGASVRWFRVQESSETVEADMEGDWRILLSTATPFDVQAERLGIVLKEKIGARKPFLEYVDLRYSERIFFRMKASAPVK